MLDLLASLGNKFKFQNFVGIIVRITLLLMAFVILMKAPSAMKLFSFPRIFQKNTYSLRPKSSHRRCSIKDDVLKNFAIFTGKHLCWSLFLIKFQVVRPATFFLKKTPTQVFFLEYCKIFKNTYVCRNAILRHITALFSSSIYICSMNRNHFHLIVKSAKRIF